jgi:hypothetical protein
MYVKIFSFSKNYSSTNSIVDDVIWLFYWFYCGFYLTPGCFRLGFMLLLLTLYFLFGFPGLTLAFFGSIHGFFHHLSSISIVLKHLYPFH